MMEAVSGAVTAAGIYLKVAEGTNKEEGDRRKKKEIQRKTGKEMAM